jgi:hypothetical protein
MIENFGLTIEIRQNPVSCVTNFYKKRLKTIIIGNGHFFLQGIEEREREEKMIIMMNNQQLMLLLIFIRLISFWIGVNSLEDGGASDFISTIIINFYCIPLFIAKNLSHIT